MLAELAIRPQGGVEFAINFADYAIARGFRNAFGQEAFDLRFDGVEDAFDRGGVGGVEEFGLGGGGGAGRGRRGGLGCIEERSFDGSPGLD